jgi:uncharacterized protein (DUF2132 family)
LQDGKSSFKDPLHGLHLKFILERLEAHYGFDTLGELIKIKCFNDNPTVKSSLTFAKTDWARKKSRSYTLVPFLNSRLNQRYFIEKCNLT